MNTENKTEEPGVEHRDPQYFGYYAMLQHQVNFQRSLVYIYT